MVEGVSSQAELERAWSTYVKCKINNPFGTLATKVNGVCP